MTFSSLRATRGSGWVGSASSSRGIEGISIAAVKGAASDSISRWGLSSRLMVVTKSDKWPMTILG